MMLPCLSRMARACASALSSPSSDVFPPLPAQKLIDAICGTFLITNCAENSGWLLGRSTIGYSLGGSTLEIWPAHHSQASVPQKSSAQRKPPLRRYSRRREASSLSRNAEPTSVIMTNGQSKRASSVKRISSGFGSPLAKLTLVRVSSLSRTDRLMSARGQSTLQLPE